MRLFDSLVPALRLADRLGLPGGISVIAIARRPDAP
jgi:hypothetical protein